VSQGAFGLIREPNFEVANSKAGRWSPRPPVIENQRSTGKNSHETSPIWLAYLKVSWNHLNGISKRVETTISFNVYRIEIFVF
jgi:hypothetical protein